MKYIISIMNESTSTFLWSVYTDDSNIERRFITSGRIYNSLLDTIAYAIEYIRTTDESYYGSVTIVHRMNGYPDTIGSITISNINDNFNYYHYAGQVKHGFDRIHKILK